MPHRQPNPTSSIDLRADLHGHVIDFACDSDRAFFAANLTAAVLERPAFAHEFCDAMTEGVPTACFDFADVVVRVTRVADGVRIREPLWSGMLLPLLKARRSA